MPQTEKTLKSKKLVANGVGTSGTLFALFPILEHYSPATIWEALLLLAAVALPSLTNIVTQFVDDFGEKLGRTIESRLPPPNVETSDETQEN